MLFMLVACEQNQVEEYEYGDLDVEHVSSYLEGETMDGKYILYYYSETCPGCNSIKQEVIPFFMNFSMLDLYLLNTAEMFDVSIFPEFVGTPSLFIIDGSKTLYETYIGVDRVREFIDEYKDIVPSVSLFKNQHITTIEEYNNFEGNYIFVFSDNYIVTDDNLWIQLFQLETDDLVLINIDEAGIDLLSELDNPQVPLLLVKTENTFENIYGEDNIISYLQND